jgi:hypothetical protein
VCETTVFGNMTVDDNANAVQIGSTDALICAGNKISGNLLADSNTGSVLIFDNSVGGTARVTNNTGLVDVVRNQVRGRLRSSDNPMLIMGGGNRAMTKQGQCD